MKRNCYLFLADQSLYMLAVGMLDVKTVLPAFVMRYSSSLVLVSLLPAIRSGFALLPQLVAAHRMRSHPRKKPWLIAGVVGRTVPIAFLATVMLAAQNTGTAVVIPTIYACLILFSVANGVGSIAWWDILGKTIPAAAQPMLFGRMMIVGSMMGFLAGGLVKALGARYGLLFASAFSALLAAIIVNAMLYEPAADQPDEADSPHGSIREFARILTKGDPFPKLLGIQVLLGLPAIADGLYTVHALRDLALPNGAVGYFVAATAAGTGVGGICLPILARRRGSISVLAVVAVSAGMAPLLVGSAGLFADESFRLLLCVASFTQQGLAATGLFIGMNSLVLTLAPEADRPLYVSVSNSIASLLVPLPIIGGILAQAFGPSPILWLCGLPTVTVLGALPAIRRQMGGVVEQAS